MLRRLTSRTASMSSATIAVSDLLERSFSRLDCFARVVFTLRLLAFLIRLWLHRLSVEHGLWKEDAMDFSHSMICGERMWPNRSLSFCR